MQSKIYLYADGGGDIGLGHASRSVGLACALKSQGNFPTFLISPESGLDFFLKNYSFKADMIDPTANNLKQKCYHEKAAALVIDSYHFHGADFLQMKGDPTLLVCFDDKGNRELPVDILINGSPGATALPYRTTSNTKKLLGPEYQIVKPEFTQNFSRAYPPEVRSILVTIGGADPLNIFKTLISLMKDCLSNRKNLEVHFVVGPYFDDPQLEKTPPFFYFHKNPKNMRELMIQADLAISTGGQTLYELARCATPTIAFCVGEDQLPQLEALAKSGSIHYIGWAGKNNWIAKLSQAIDGLIVRPETRKILGIKASQLIDGRGAFRIVEVMQTLIDSWI